MKTTTMTYGFPELREVYKSYISGGLLIAGLVHFALITGYQVYIEYSNERIEFPKIMRTKGTIVIPAPPPIGNSYTVPKLSIASTVSAHQGIPVPVPETIFNTNETFPNQKEMNRTYVGEDIGDNTGTVTKIGDGAIIRDDFPPPPFVPVEKEPIVITRVNPVYPEIPRRAGVEGTVYVKMWVTKEGKVRSAEIVKSTSPLFEKSALEAAVLWTFTPAVMNNGPIGVWVTVPFRFLLQNN